MFRTFLLLLLITPLAGCSALGLSLFPTGHYLTEQTEEVLKRSPSTAKLPRELNRTVVAAHYLEPGDVLLIETVKLDSDVRLPADQHVMADGSIDLGGYGRVVVAGLTLEDAEALVEQTLVEEGEEATKINIRLLEAMHRFYVLGEVNSPGSYPLTGFETVLDGILAAGGLTSDAAPCKLLLARPTTSHSCRVTLPVCYREITQMGDTATNYQLQPGDRIYVASRTFCEELMFWQATQTCDRCCKCQTACPHPETVSTIAPVIPGMIGVPMARQPFPQEVMLSPESWQTQSVPSDDSYLNVESAPSFRSNLEMLPSAAGTSDGGTGLDEASQELESSRIFVPRSSKPRTSAGASPSLDGQLDFAEPMMVPNSNP
ncbi:polysaccharide biosynthesis/export family protein [Novipirellula sp. SH528]|uniref:polysaccharide biosynthesis/export family protein n=1 Tax=Novipirellula sp. SH528 TaxID=3454466 RepID=UPI003FA16AE6